MYCDKCGNQLNLEDKFCNNCGTAIQKNNIVNLETPIELPNTNNENDILRFYDKAKRFVWVSLFLSVLFTGSMLIISGETIIGAFEDYEFTVISLILAILIIFYFGFVAGGFLIPNMIFYITFFNKKMGIRSITWLSLILPLFFVFYIGTVIKEFIPSLEGTFYWWLIILSVTLSLLINIIICISFMIIKFKELPKQQNVTFKRIISNIKFLEIGIIFIITFMMQATSNVILFILSIIYMAISIVILINKYKQNKIKSTIMIIIFVFFGLGYLM